MATSGDDTANDQNRSIALGVITGAHGIRGAVKVKPFTESPENFSAYGPLHDEAGQRYKAKIERQVKDQLICRLEGISDRNAAEALRKTWLYIDRDQLPDDQDHFYQVDMIGAEVQDENGQVVGTAAGFFDFGGGEMIEVTRNDGGKVMLPFALSLRQSVDVETATIRMSIDPVWLEPSPKKPADENS
jgi:16S rRNA processing protein RimM